MPRTNNKKRKAIEDDGAGDVTILDTTDHRHRRSYRRVVSEYCPPIKVEDPLGGMVKCPECSWVVLKTAGCNVTTCRRTEAHNGKFFFFCYHCKAEAPCGEYLKCDCRKSVKEDALIEEQEKRNKRAALCPVDLTNGDNDDTIIDRKSSGENDDGSQGISNELRYDSDDGTTTSGRSSFFGTPSPSSSLPSSSPPTDDETDGDTLKPPAKSTSTRPPSRFPSLSPSIDDEDTLIAGGHRGNSSTTEPTSKDDDVTVAGQIGHSAIEYQAHTEEAMITDTTTVDESNGNDSDAIVDNQLPKLRELEGDDSVGGIGKCILEDAAEVIDQDDGDDDYPPPPPLPGQVVKAGNSPFASPGGKFKADDEGWNERLDELREYKDQNGHCNVPKRQAPLHNWVTQQRKLYRKKDGNQSSLTDERVAALNAIGFEWGSTYRRTGWSERLVELREYNNKKGHCNVPQSQGPLGLWVKIQRSEYRKKKLGKQTALTDERVAALDALGFEWDGRKGGKPKDGLWNERLVELREYKKEKGHCNVPRSQGTLGVWVRSQRRLYQKREAGEQTPLTDERVAALDALGFEWGTGNDERWNERLAELRDYKEENGDCNVPQSQGTLGVWVKTQRNLYRKRKDGEQTPLTDERIAALEAIGFEWVWNAV